MNWFRHFYLGISNWVRNLIGKLKNKLPFFYVAGLVLLFGVFFLYNNIVHTVRSGEGGVLYRLFFGGTVVDRVYSEGVHFILPWDRMYIYNIRIQQIPYSFDVLTKNGMKITLDLSIRYYPERDLLGVLHKTVGPDYAKTVVIPEIEHVLRVIIGKMSAEEVYTTKRFVIEKYINEAVEKVHRRFVSVDTVIIKKISLPPRVEEIIQYKVENIHLVEAQKFKVQRQREEKIRKRVEGEGMRDYNNIVNSSLTPEVLQWMAIQATLTLAQSENSKVVVVGSGKGGLPVFGNMVLDAPDNMKILMNETRTAEVGPDNQTAQPGDTKEMPDPYHAEMKETSSVDIDEKGVLAPLIEPRAPRLASPLEPPHADR